MPVRAPATRDQVDAYRYGLRRLEAALVRGDPVPLHEQIRTQRRAAFVGVLLGLLGLCGAAAFAAISPQPDWRRQDVVIGAGSGAMYVVAHQPDRLVPVADLLAARLVLAALRTDGATDADPATASPVTVPDTVLDGAPRTPSAGVPGALDVRPDAPPVPPQWAVCDEVTGEGALRATTVIGGGPPAPTRHRRRAPDGRSRAHRPASAARCARPARAAARRAGARHTGHSPAWRRCPRRAAGAGR
jgi:hypothetical protein